MCDGICDGSSTCTCKIFFISILTVETCDERTIPSVDHATHELKRSLPNTKVPQLYRQNFSIPKFVNVTYTCEEGYRLQEPDNNVIGCEYVTTPRKGRRERDESVVAKAVWTSAERIICIKSKI